MNYQGEDWCIVLKGDEYTNLENNDFKVFIYPCGSPQSVSFTADKSQCANLGYNKYQCIVPHDTTKSLAIGIYSLEVLLISGEMTRTVFVKEKAIYNNPSASSGV